MQKPRTDIGEKNLIAERLKLLRKKHKLSQKKLEIALQLIGVDMDRNVISRIENQKRYVNDIELKALTKIFQVSYDYLIEGKEKNTP